MPNKYNNPEQQAKLFSVYLRPWVLIQEWAVRGHVPHLCDLNLALHHRLSGKVRAPRSYTLAWQRYINGHVVSRHAARIIVQFMTACYGKSRKEVGTSEESVHD